MPNIFSSLLLATWQHVNASINVYKVKIWLHVYCKKCNGHALKHFSIPKEAHLKHCGNYCCKGSATFCQGKVLRSSTGERNYVSDSALLVECRCMTFQRLHTSATVTSSSLTCCSSAIPNVCIMFPSACCRVESSLGSFHAVGVKPHDNKNINNHFTPIM